MSLSLVQSLTCVISWSSYTLSSFSTSSSWTSAAPSYMTPEGHCSWFKRLEAATRQPDLPWPEAFLTASAIKENCLALYSAAVRVIHT